MELGRCELDYIQMEDICSLPCRSKHREESKCVKLMNVCLCFLVLICFTVTHKFGYGGWQSIMMVAGLSSEKGRGSITVSTS